MKRGDNGNVLACVDIKIGCPTYRRIFARRSPNCPCRAQTGSSVWAPHKMHIMKAFRTVTVEVSACLLSRTPPAHATLSLQAPSGQAAVNSAYNTNIAGVKLG